MHIRTNWKFWEYKIEESCAPFLNEEERLQRFNIEIIKWNRINKGMVKICKLIEEKKMNVESRKEGHKSGGYILRNCKGYLIKRQSNFV